MDEAKLERLEARWEAERLRAQKRIHGAGLLDERSMELGCWTTTVCLHWKMQTVADFVELQTLSASPSRRI